MVILKLAISNKSSSSQTKRQQTHSPLRHSNALTDPLIGPRQQRYDFVVIWTRRLRNLHLDLCGGAPGLSIRWYEEYELEQYLDQYMLSPTSRDEMCLSGIPYSIILDEFIERIEYRSSIPASRWPRLRIYAIPASSYWNSSAMLILQSGMSGRGSSIFPPPNIEEHCCID